MSNVDKDIERLIVRSLDGELSEDEALALNRELIRDPEAHRLMESYRRADELAAAALERAIGAGGPSFDPMQLAASSAKLPKRGWHRGWLLLPGAVAAALLALMIRLPAAPPADSSAGAQLATGDRGSMQHSVPVVGNARKAGGPLMRNVDMRPRIKRDSGREVLGVVGDDGNIYWIEIGRVQTVKKPSRQALYQLAVGGI